MLETSGLVMKVTDKFIVVLCDDGKFRNQPLMKNNPLVGERITVPIMRKKQISTSWLFAAAACVFIFFGAIVWAQTMKPQYDQVVAIDINPSLELYLNSDREVMKAVPLNADAEKLLKELSLRKLQIEDAVEQVLSKSIALGYVEKGKENNIVITIVKIRGKSEVDAATIEAVVAKTLQSNHLEGTVKIEHADKVVYEQALEKKLSLNEWLSILQSEQLEMPIDVEMYTPIPEKNDSRPVTGGNTIPSSPATNSEQQSEKLVIPDENTNKQTNRSQSSAVDEDIEVAEDAEIDEEADTDEKPVSKGDFKLNKGAGSSNRPDNSAETGTAEKAQDDEKDDVYEQAEHHEESEDIEIPDRPEDDSKEAEGEEEEDKIEDIVYPDDSSDEGAYNNEDDNWSDSNRDYATSNNSNSSKK
ncbi:anti-sigma-I factor RsgI family protein [Paenibacillus sp. sgz302251]|uniref:anti-sigma factor domain-containing protein n=1 Tax=Paenibacillus sp. sgz302251 TaxID=3414493 RepID=UPI003C7C6F12